MFNEHKYKTMQTHSTAEIRYAFLKAAYRNLFQREARPECIEMIISKAREDDYEKS